MGAIDGWLEGFLHGQVGVGVILLVSLLSARSSLRRFCHYPAQFL